MLQRLLFITPFYKNASIGQRYSSILSISVAVASSSSIARSSYGECNHAPYYVHKYEANTHTIYTNICSSFLIV